MIANRTVLVLHPSDEAYGADRVLLDLVRGLTARGWRFVVLLPDEVPVGWLSARLSEAGAIVERAPLAVARRRVLGILTIPGYVASLLRARRAVRGVARRVDARIIHLNTSALLVGAIIGRLTGLGTVWQIHEIVARPRLLAWMFRAAPGLGADAVIVVSDAVRQHLLTLPWRRGRVVRILNGIAAVGPRPMAGLRSGNGPLIAYVGRLNRWKGYEVFVEAVAQISERYPTADFVLAGDPPFGEEWRAESLRQDAAAAGVTGRLRLLGHVPDGAAVCSAADIVAVPSTSPDPLPTVVLEGMRAGCAVVVSAHGGAPEMIEDGVSGILVPPGDAVALARAIAGLLDDPGRRERIGSAARERVRAEFSVERMLDQVERVYLDLLQ